MRKLRLYKAVLAGWLLWGCGAGVALAETPDVPVIPFRDTVLLHTLADSLTAVNGDTAVVASDTTGRFRPAVERGDSIPSFSGYLSDTVMVRGGVMPVIPEEERERKIQQKLDSLSGKRRKEPKLEVPFSPLAQTRSRLFKDTLSFQTVSAISFVAPGFGQIYNNQYWKLPILYGGVGAFAGLAAYAGKQQKDYSGRYHAAVAAGAASSEIRSLQHKMDNFKRQKTLYIAGAAATYLYFVGDAAMNYKGFVKTPQKATMLSAIFPGAGQIYNKSYWKLPILYGGIATVGYLISFNNRGYQRFKKAYNDLTDGDDSTVDEFNGRYSASVLQNTRDSYRRYRDLNIIIMGGLYILNIVDAHVDAYLKKYDISDDLSLKVEPTVTPGPTLSRRRSGQVMGMSVKLNF